MSDAVNMACSELMVGASIDIQSVQLQLLRYSYIVTCFSEKGILIKRHY